MGIDDTDAAVPGYVHIVSDGGYIIVVAVSAKTPMGLLDRVVRVASIHDANPLRPIREEHSRRQKSRLQTPRTNVIAAATLQIVRAAGLHDMQTIVANDVDPGIRDGDSAYRTGNGVCVELSGQKLVRDGGSLTGCDDDCRVVCIPTWHGERDVVGPVRHISQHAGRDLASVVAIQRNSGTGWVRRHLSAGGR
jgi:hypothetical protein